MPGSSAATQSSQLGNNPKAPSGVSTTIRETPDFSAKIWNGSKIFRVMGVVGETMNSDASGGSVHSSDYDIRW
jgi:hypothetical protein